jgi:hypothetical protein
MIPRWKRSFANFCFFVLQVPDAYLRAIFGSFLASRFIYSMGISASPVSFFAFMNKRMNKSAQAVVQ